MRPPADEPGAADATSPRCSSCRRRSPSRPPRRRATAAEDQVWSRSPPRRARPRPVVRPATDPSIDIVVPPTTLPMPTPFVSLSTPGPARSHRRDCGAISGHILAMGGGASYRTRIEDPARLAARRGRGSAFADGGGAAARSSSDRSTTRSGPRLPADPSRAVRNAGGSGSTGRSAGRDLCRRRQHREHARDLARARRRRRPARGLGARRRPRRLERRCELLVRGLRHRLLRPAPARARRRARLSGRELLPPLRRRAGAAPDLHAAVRDGVLTPGYAADDDAAFHFEGTELREVVSQREGARGYCAASTARSRSSRGCCGRSRSSPVRAATARRRSAASSRAAWRCHSSRSTASSTARTGSRRPTTSCARACCPSWTPMAGSSTGPTAENSEISFSSARTPSSGSTSRCVSGSPGCCGAPCAAPRPRGALERQPRVAARCVLGP